MDPKIEITVNLGPIDAQAFRDALEVFKDTGHCSLPVPAGHVLHYVAALECKESYGKWGRWEKIGINDYIEVAPGIYGPGIYEGYCVAQRRYNFEELVWHPDPAWNWPGGLFDHAVCRPQRTDPR